MPFAWAVGAFTVVIIVLPMYLVHRGKQVRMSDDELRASAAAMSEADRLRRTLSQLALVALGVGAVLVIIALGDAARSAPIFSAEVVRAFILNPLALVGAALVVVGLLRPRY